MKAWFKSRTMWAAFGVGVLGLMQVALETAPIPEQFMGLVVMGIGFLIAGLRAVTSKAVGAGDA